MPSSLPEPSAVRLEKDEVTPFDAAPELVNGEFSPKIAPDYSVPPTRLEQLKASNWRPVAVFAGALLVGGLLAPLVIAPANPGAKVAAVSSWELSLPASSTMLTALSAAPGAPLRGQVAPVADITGKAPVGGAVARWVVEPGARVEAGQPVVQISSGAASAPALPGETKQIEAEQQQTAAADDQLALSQRLTQTQQKLATAQLRVEQAQQNIGQTRALIARLRAGEAAPPDAASPDSSSAPAPRNKSNLSNSGVAAARAKSRDAQSGYDDTKAQLKTARDDLSAAQQALTPLQSKLDEAQANVKTVEGKWDGSFGQRLRRAGRAFGARQRQRHAQKRHDAHRDRAKTNPGFGEAVGQPRTRRRRRAPRRARHHRRRARRGRQRAQVRLWHNRPTCRRTDLNQPNSTLDPEQVTISLPTVTKVELASFPNPPPSKEVRQQIRDNTLASIPDIHRYFDKPLEAASVFYDSQLPCLDPAQSPNLSYDKVTIEFGDTFVLTRAMRRYRRDWRDKIAVLNCASDAELAGGWKHRAGTTQEDALCYSSTLLPTLEKWKHLYPWRSHCVSREDGNEAECAGIFSPAVYMFKDELSKNCKELER